MLGSSNSAANKDMIAKIWTKWGYNYLIELNGNGKIFRYEQFPPCFLKQIVDVLKRVSME